MNSGRTVFSQLISFLPDREFRRCVSRYQGDHRLREFSCWDQYLTMAFAQLTYRESLRDIEACLRSLHGKLYHMGFHSRVARSTLADANESRDWRIYAGLCRGIDRHRAAVICPHDPIGVDLDHSLYALDSTTIDLCRTRCFRGRGSANTSSRCQDAHAAGPARQHPHVYPHYRRQSARRQGSSTKFCPRRAPST